MKRSMIAAAMLVLLSAGASFGEVKTLVQYRLGEDDSGAAAGNAVESTTMPNEKPMTATGKPTYVAVPADAPHAGWSKLAIAFTGKDYLQRSGLAIPNDNFGIEAWVKADTEDGFHYVVSFGSGVQGFSLVRNKKGYQVLLGGVNLVGWSNDVPAGQWVHIAVVRNNGHTEFYCNGQAMGGSDQKPNAAGEHEGFAIGASGDGKEGFFSGTVDEVRVFTFEAGKFNAADLQAHGQAK